MNVIHTSTGEPYEPGWYEIRLKGHLDDRWADWFEGLTITREASGHTLLTGPVVDQAALHGLLRKVRDLGLPLVSVMQVDPKRAEGSDGNADTDHHRSNKEKTHERQEPHPLDRRSCDGGRDHLRRHSADPST